MGSNRRKRTKQYSESDISDIDENTQPPTTSTKDTSSQHFPRFILVESKEENKPITSLSPFVIQKVREKSRECHNHKPQPFPDPKRKRKPTNLNKHKQNKRTKSTKMSSLFPKRGIRNTKRTEKHKQEQNDTRKDIQQIAS